MANSPIDPDQQKEHPLNHVPCPNCGQMVDDRAVACPNCGEKIYVETPADITPTRHRPMYESPRNRPSRQE